jgi:hypothetical protein
MMAQVYLEDLTKRKGPFTKKRVAQVQKWIDDDWESKDVQLEAVDLIQRLVRTVQNLENKLLASEINAALSRGRRRA